MRLLSGRGLGAGHPPLAPLSPRLDSQLRSESLRAPFHRSRVFAAPGIARSQLQLPFVSGCLRALSLVCDSVGVCAWHLNVILCINQWDRTVPPQEAELEMRERGGSEGCGELGEGEVSGAFQSVPEQHGEEEEAGWGRWLCVSGETAAIPSRQQKSKRGEAAER